MRVGNRLQRFPIRRMPEHIHGEDRLGVGGDRPLHRRRVDAQRERVDIGEHRSGPLEQDAVGGRDERERRGDHLITGSDPHSADDQVKRAGAAVHGHRVADAGVGGKRLFKRLRLRSEGEASGTEHRVHRRDIRLADLGHRQRDLRLCHRVPSQVSRARLFALKCPGFRKRSHLTAFRSSRMLHG